MPSRYWTRRLARHLAIFAASTLAAVALFFRWESPQLVYRISMATAYPGLALLALSLLLGPLNVLRNRPNPVSFDLRRDLGIWGAMFSLVHVVAGIQVHMGNPWYYFIFQPELRGSIPVRYDLFGLTNYAGLVATIGLVVLLVFSNDRSLARLGVTRWKNIQRLNYVIFLAVVGHGLVFQLLEDRPLAWIVLVACVAGIVAWLQFTGFRRVRDGQVGSASRSRAH